MNWLTFFYEAGGKFFDEQGKIAVNSPEGIKAMQAMVDILHIKLLMKAYSHSNQMMQEYYFSRAGSIFNGAGFCH